MELADISLCALLVFISLLSFIISLLLKHYCACRNEKDLAKCCKPKEPKLEELNVKSSTLDPGEEVEVDCHQVESTLMNESLEDWDFIGIAPDEHPDCNRHVGRKQMETEHFDTVQVSTDPPTYVTRVLVH
jgi:hypothetical protein